MAGTILGVGHPLLDNRDEGVSDEVASPGRARAALAVGAFSSQYWLSGELAARTAAAAGGQALPLAEHAAGVDAPLAAAALALWLGFDRTRGGLFLCALTGVCGPLIEAALINGLHLYEYTWPDEGFLGTPSWICWVYAGGAPAVGAVGRLIRGELARSPAEGRAR